MRLILALLAGKLLHMVISLFRDASSLPGRAALAICPDLPGRLHIKGRVLAITGSNGKTTTANLVAHILRENGFSVANNAKGSNMLGGAATALLCAANLRGEVREDFVVLEVDERYSSLIFRDFSPELLLVTNLFRDQLTRNGNVDVISAKLSETISPSIRLVLNANDPISGSLSPANPRAYFRMERTPLSCDISENITHDARVCPKCLAPLRYEYYHYNHIGKFFCPGCGYESAGGEYVASEVDFSSGAFKINGVSLVNSYKNAFHFLNLTAAVALCCEAGIPLEHAVRAAESFCVSTERYDELSLHGRPALMILSKNQNPVSFDQSISYVRSLPGEKTVIAYINNINHTGHKDTTWLYDIAFERLREAAGTVIAAGPRAYDLAVRLRLAGFSDEEILLAPKLPELPAAVAKTRGTICIMTELYDANSILSVLKK